MDGNPWGSVWSEPEKETIQEVILKPKVDAWLTSPASGDLGVAWSSSTSTQWGTRDESQAAWKPATTTFGSESTPWGSAFDARAADVLGGSENSRSLEPTPLKNVFGDQHGLSSVPPQPRDEKVLEEGNAESLPISDDPSREIEKPNFVAPFEVQEGESADRWRTLENAAITVGNDAGWETAWKPEANEEDARAESPTGAPDDWAEAVQQKILRDAKVPPGVMDVIFTRYKDLETNLWPDGNLETAREGPAPRAEWQGGLENVDGLTALVNRYLPPNTSAPPIRFESTEIAMSFHNAMKLTKSYGMIQKSPLNRLVRTSESWEQSVRLGGNSKPFSLEAWLSSRDSSALSMSSPYVSGSENFEMESHRKTVGLMGKFSRPSVDQGRASSSRSSTPRVSQDGTPSTMSLASPINGSTTPISPPSNSLPTESTAQTTAPSAVTRFLSRFSRRTEDAPKQPAPVNLRPDELDFLDTVPAVDHNGPIVGSIQKDLDSVKGTPGLQALSAGSSVIATPTPPRQGILDPTTVNKLMSNVNLGQITSKDFETLLDAQIMEMEDERTRESLIAASILPAPIDSRYSKLHIPLFGSKVPNGAQPLTNPESTRPETLLDDDDDFNAFLSSSTPSKVPTHARSPSQPSIIPSAFAPIPLSFAAQNNASSFMRTGALPNTRPGSSKVSPTPSRGPTVAIMSQNTGSRPSTPATMPIAPLLPPPPGSRTPRSPPVQSQGDLWNSSTTSKSQTPSAPKTTNATQMDMLFGLSSPPVSMVPNATPAATPKNVPPSAAPTIGGLSAQDLSFFEAF